MNQQLKKLGKLSATSKDHHETDYLIVLILTSDIIADPLNALHTWRLRWNFQHRRLLLPSLQHFAHFRQLWQVPMQRTLLRQEVHKALHHRGRGSLAKIRQNTREAVTVATPSNNLSGGKTKHRSLSNIASLQSVFPKTVNHTRWKDYLNFPDLNFVIQR